MGRGADAASEFGRPASNQAYRPEVARLHAVRLVVDEPHPGPEVRRTLRGAPAQDVSLAQSRPVMPMSA